MVKQGIKDIPSTVGKRYLTATCVGIALLGIVSQVVRQQLPSVSDALPGSPPFWDSTLTFAVYVAIALVPLSILIDQRNTADLRLWLLLAAETFAPLTSRNIANGLFFGGCGYSHYGAIGCSAAEASALPFLFLISGLLQCAGAYLLITSFKKIRTSGLPAVERSVFFFGMTLYNLIAFLGNNPYGS